MDRPCPCPQIAGAIKLEFDGVQGPLHESASLLNRWSRASATPIEEMVFDAAVKGAKPIPLRRHLIESPSHALFAKLTLDYSVPEPCAHFAVFEPITTQAKGKNMRASILVAFLVAGFALPAAAATHPVKGAVHGTATAGRGVVTGAGQAGRGIARGTVTVARGVGRGAVCLFTLGTRCR